MMSKPDYQVNQGYNGKCRGQPKKKMCLPPPLLVARPLKKRAFFAATLIKGLEFIFASRF